MDEVHEREVDTDFLLALLQPLLRKRKNLKLILMVGWERSEELCLLVMGLCALCDVVLWSWVVCVCVCIC